VRGPQTPGTGPRYARYAAPTQQVSETKLSKEQPRYDHTHSEYSVMAIDKTGKSERIARVAVVP